MPPELLNLLQLDLPLRRRDPHYFLPTQGSGGKYLLLGSDAEATRRQFVDFFSEVRGCGANGGCIVADWWLGCSRLSGASVVLERLPCEMSEWLEQASSNRGQCGSAQMQQLLCALSASR